MGQLPKINTEKEDLGVKLSAIENLTNDLEMHSTNKKLGTRWAYQWGAHFCTLAKVDMAILTYGYVYPIGLTKAMRNIYGGNSKTFAICQIFPISTFASVKKWAGVT